MHASKVFKNVFIPVVLGAVFVTGCTGVKDSESSTQTEQPEVSQDENLATSRISIDLPPESVFSQREKTDGFVEVSDIEIPSIPARGVLVVTEAGGESFAVESAANALIESFNDSQGETLTVQRASYVDDIVGSSGESYLASVAGQFERGFILSIPAGLEVITILLVTTEPDEVADSLLIPILQSVSVNP
jgi:hypothetical protein